MKTIYSTHSLYGVVIVKEQDVKKDIVNALYEGRNVIKDVIVRIAKMVEMK
jgi:hypothetical protein